MEGYKNLSEEDTRNIYITPALNRVGEIPLVDISSSHTTTACRSALGGSIELIL